MMALTWRAEMSVGVSSLDDDHKKIVALINQVETILTLQKFDAVAKVVDSLLTYVEEHFRNEETVMKHLGYPDLAFHQKLHKGLSNRVDGLAKACAAAVADPERRRIAHELNEFLQGWLSDHILVEDMRFKASIPRKASRAREPQSGPIPVAAALPHAMIPVPPPPPRRTAKSEDLEYSLPPELAHLLARMEYVVPTMPDPAGPFESFDRLCDAAINRRANKVLIFFQRHNPTITRELPTFFLAAPAFADQFRVAVSTFILPSILENRQVRQLSISRDWTTVTDETFWSRLDRTLRAAILHCWESAWDDLKLVSTKKTDGTTVLLVKETTKALRALLAPATPDAYDIPRVGNREIDTFKSLLDTNVDWWEELNDAWQVCHDLYEQEKDPRMFQSRAREGALRDNLLNAFGRFPDSWCDFLLLACHRVFPRVSSTFLESFAASIATKDSVRESYLPYTMRYLTQVKEHPTMREREIFDELAHQAEMKKVRDYLTGRRPA